MPVCWLVFLRHGCVVGAVVDSLLLARETGSPLLLNYDWVRTIQPRVRGISPRQNIAHTEAASQTGFYAYVDVLHGLGSCDTCPVSSFS